MPIDRTTTTPFLIRAFPCHGSFHSLNEFDHDLQPRDEINLYSWKDATLGELTTLLAKELVGPSDRAVSSFRFNFRLVFGDNNRGRYQTRDIGSVQVGKKTRDSEKTLDDVRFIIGDWIDIAVLQPGDRLYDHTRNEERDYKHPYRGNNGNYRGQRDRSYRGSDSFRSNDRYDRNDRARGGFRGAAPVDGRRWDNDNYRSR